MPNFDLSVIINRPLDDVWAVISDPTQMPKWRKVLKKVEMLTDEPYGLGSRGRDTERMMGRDQVTTWEVTEYEEKKRISLRAIEGPFPFEGSMTVAEAEGGTSFSFNAKFGFKGIFVLLGPFMRPWIKGQIKGDLNGLKTLVESGG